MKQIIQSLKNGETSLVDVPAPMVSRGKILIKTRQSLVSLGTEKMLVQFGKANILDKVRQQPDKVKMVLNKVKTDGLEATYNAVKNKLDEPITLGYCNVGEVIAIGAGVTTFQIGDRVVSNGAHAEVVSIPENLVAKIPDSVSDEQACFTVVGAIGLQGMRLLRPTFGETVVVSGLGLIGLLTAQLLKANGCRVIGIDPDRRKIDLGMDLGIQTIHLVDGIDSVRIVHDLTHGHGADGVVITASTQSNSVVSDAANMCRKRGRIILVGVVGLQLNRDDFYKKELSFQVSSSYGPGRYEPNYEQKGLDYPIGFVRWTEKRNFEAVLEAMRSGSLHVERLITSRVPINDYEKIYGDLENKDRIADLLIYEDIPTDTLLQRTILRNSHSPVGKVVIGIIGAGNFVSSTILPKLKKENASVKTIVSQNGLSAELLSKKYSIPNISSDINEVMNDPEINTVIIATRHNSHAALCMKALESQKNVFVEKPLAIRLDNYYLVEEMLSNTAHSLTVGFNRRFSPLSMEIKKILGNTSKTPMHINYTMNAGFIPADHWVHDPDIGGGRVVGEACHAIDYINFLTDSLVDSVFAESLGTDFHLNTDNVSILLKQKNGSTATIQYTSQGHKGYPKERIEIHSLGNTMVLNNFRKLEMYGAKNLKKSIKQDKGHQNQFKNLIHHIEQGKGSIIPIDQTMNASKATLYVLESLKTKKPIIVDSII